MNYSKANIVMLENKLKQSDIVRKYGFDKGDVSKVCQGQRRGDRIRRAILGELALLGVIVDNTIFER
jgi:hypothetical protein